MKKKVIALTVIAAVFLLSCKNTNHGSRNYGNAAPQATQITKVTVENTITELALTFEPSETLAEIAMVTFKGVDGIPVPKKTDLLANTAFL